MRTTELHTRRSFLALGYGAAALLTGVRRAGAAVAKKPLPPFDLSFIGKDITLCRRKEWTESQAEAWKLREGGVYDRITVHHQGGEVFSETDKSAVIAELDSVYAGHMRKHYADIAYHFIIDYAGRVWEGRSLAYEGAHVMHQNRNNLGILVLGNYEEQQPSEASLTTLDSFIPVLRHRFGIKHHRVYGHRDLGASLCPGRNLYPHVAAIRNGSKNAERTRNAER